MSNFNHNHFTIDSTLYIVVFTSRFVGLIVLALIFSFLLQPIDQVWADETSEPIDVTENSVVLEPVPIVKVADDTNEVIKNDNVSADSETIDSLASNEEWIETNATVAEIESESISSNNSDVNNVELSGVDSEMVNGSSTSTSSNSTVTTVDKVTNNVPVNSNTAIDTETIASSTTTEEDEIFTPTSTPLSQDEPIDSDVSDVDADIDDASDTNIEAPEESLTDENKVTSTTSTDVASSSGKLDETIVVVDTSNRHQFNSNECITVGSGAFYCNEAESAVKYNDNGVFSSPDSDGDREIFVQLDGKEVQISNNLVDDNSPYYDVKSDRIVWHTFINDRYQIVSYNLKNNESELLTDSTYNNMEPVADGEIVLWQAWIKNNWEIVMSVNGQINQLTNNDTHDVAPSIRGDYIVWQTQFADGWKVALFNKDTNEVEYIDGLNEAAMAENPRFVLVFDQIDNNGDISTVGYDFDSKATIHLGSLPRELPDELPEPEKTNEKKALVQTKPSTKEADDNDIDNNKPATTTPNIISSTTPTASSTNPADIPVLIIPPVLEDDSSTSTSAVHELIPEEPLSTSTVDIPDVVIPPYSTSTDEVSG